MKEISFEEWIKRIPRDKEEPRSLTAVIQINGYGKTFQLAGVLLRIARLLRVDGTVCRFFVLPEKEGLGLAGFFNNEKLEQLVELKEDKRDPGW